MVGTGSVPCASALILLFVYYFLCLFITRDNTTTRGATLPVPLF